MAMAWQQSARQGSVLVWLAVSYFPCQAQVLDMYPDHVHQLCWPLHLSIQDGTEHQEGKAPQGDKSRGGAPSLPEGSPIRSLLVQHSPTRPHLQAG